MTNSSLNDALRHFEATEANLIKLEKVLANIEVMIPAGISFGSDPEYDLARQNFDALWISLPKIDKWKPDIEFLELDEIAQSRLDAQDIGEPEAIVRIEQQIGYPSRQISEYRFRFDQKRQELIRDSLIGQIDAVDEDLRVLSQAFKRDVDSGGHGDSLDFEALTDHVAQINTLLGGSVNRPARWHDLGRHIHFGTPGDLRDIIEHDWPSIKAGIKQSMYGELEPIPVGVDDLGALVGEKPTGPVATKLQWDRLSDEEFERLIFVLISSEPGYENPTWLMKTTAPNRGRDLSVDRVYEDRLGGTSRRRVIIQCRHWLTKSVGPKDISLQRDQMKLWEPPRVDVVVMATSGRFTSDAVAMIEKHNQSDNALSIEPWPESHLEHILARRPDVIAQFRLR